MSLDRELRTVLGEEAEMATPSLPDIDGLIRGGQVRRRRRGIARIGMATVAAVLVAGGVYGVAQVEREDAGAGIATQPTLLPETAASTYPNDGRELAPGTYRKTVGSSSSGAAVAADLSFDGRGWSAADHPVKGPDDDAGPYVGVAVLQADSLPRDSGCMSTTSGASTFGPAPRSIGALADALAALPDSVVLQQVTTTTAFGHDARHLRLRIDTSVCTGPTAYALADGPPGPVGISYGSTPRIVVDLTVVDVDGTAIVVAQWNNVDTPWNLVDEATRVRDSVRFVR